MRTLAPEDRENVVYVDLDNRVYANKPELLQDLYLAPMATDNSYISPTGEVVAVPRLTSRPASFGRVTPLGVGAVSPLVVTPAPDSRRHWPFPPGLQRGDDYCWLLLGVSQYQPQRLLQRLY